MATILFLPGIFVEFSSPTTKLGEDPLPSQESEPRKLSNSSSSTESGKVDTNYAEAMPAVPSGEKPILTEHELTFLLLLFITQRSKMARSYRHFCLYLQLFLFLLYLCDIGSVSIINPLFYVNFRSEVTIFWQIGHTHGR